MTSSHLLVTHNASPHAFPNGPTRNQVSFAVVSPANGTPAERGRGHSGAFVRGGGGRSEETEEGEAEQAGRFGFRVGNGNGNSNGNGNFIGDSRGRRGREMNNINNATYDIYGQEGAAGEDGQVEDADDEEDLSGNPVKAAIRSVTIADLREVGTLTNPPAAVKALAEALCILFNVKPAKTRCRETNKTVFDYWSVAKRVSECETFLATSPSFQQRYM